MGLRATTCNSPFHAADGAFLPPDAYNLATTAQPIICQFWKNVLFVSALLTGAYKKVKKLYTGFNVLFISPSYNDRKMACHKHLWLAISSHWVVKRLERLLDFTCQGWLIPSTAQRTGELTLVFIASMACISRLALSLSVLSNKPRCIRFSGTRPIRITPHFLNRQYLRYSLSILDNAAWISSVVGWYSKLNGMRIEIPVLDKSAGCYKDAHRASRQLLLP